MTLSHEEKINLMRSLNWDYTDSLEDMLAVVEGRLETSGALDRPKLLVRSLERIPWHYLIALWGVDAVKELYTPELAGRIWPKDRRKHFDFALAILRGEPVSPPEWGSEYYKSLRNTVFSDRWYRAEPGVL
jgi:hypothetical protein